MGNEMVKEIDKDPAVDISDHIAEAYFGEMGEAMRQSSVKRIDWICEQACGPRVLDVGCSQGITEILLGRRKIHALGVDIAPKAIAYAEKLLAAEAPDVREYVRFLCSDFLVEDLPEKEFDTLILSEILEHLYEPEEMLKKPSYTSGTAVERSLPCPSASTIFPITSKPFMFWESGSSCKNTR